MVRTGDRRAVTGDQPVSGQVIGAVRCHHSQHNVVARLGQAIDPVLAANFNRRTGDLGGNDRLMQERLEIGLLQVDKGGKGVAILW